MRVYIAKIQIIRFKHVLKPDTALKACKYSNYIPSTIKAVLCTDTIIDPILPAFSRTFVALPTLFPYILYLYYLCTFVACAKYIIFNSVFITFIRCIFARVMF